MTFPCSSCPTIPMDAREGQCSSVLLSANERAFVVGFIQQLNLVIQQQVRQHGDAPLGRPWVRWSWRRV